MCPVDVLLLANPFDAFVAGSRVHLRINKYALHEMM